MPAARVKWKMPGLDSSGVQTCRLLLMRITGTSTSPSTAKAAVNSQSAGANTPTAKVHTKPTCPTGRRGSMRKARRSGIIDCSYCSPPVRILPLNLQEFPGCHTAADVQEKFFLHELPLREDGCFRYRERGLKAEPGTVVLFQCENGLLAAAVFSRVQLFDQADAQGYRGGQATPPFPDCLPSPQPLLQSTVPVDRASRQATMTL
jgi:hypothetical protein